MPESKGISDLEAEMADRLARFSVSRDLAEEVILQLEKAPLRKLQSAVLRLVQRSGAGPVTAALLKLARRTGEYNPTRGTHLARLALIAAEMGDVGDLPESVKRGILAEAETLMGDGWRRRGDFRKADQAFARAALHLENVWNPHERSLYLCLLGRLREDQHYEEEALALWARAAALFGEIGQIDEQAEALLDKAALELCLNRVENALADLRSVLALSDKGLRPDLAAIAVVGYGTLLGEMRRTMEALAVIDAFRERYSGFRAHPAMAEVDLLEGALLIFSDRHEIAEARLEAARREFLIHRQFEASGEASLNLALLFLLDSRREPDLGKLVDESIEPLTRISELPGELRGALGAFCLAVRNGTATAGLAGVLRQNLRSSRDASDSKSSAAGKTRQDQR